MILAGDVGGTKTALGLFELRDGELVPVREDAVPSREFPTFEAAIAGFLAAGAPARLDAACFGVAGPVFDGRCVTTNLPWHLAEADLAAAIPTPRVRLLNDLEAAAHGILALPPSSLATLQPGAGQLGNAVLIAAGRS